MKTKLRIIQPPAGVKVDVDPSKEKWLVVELTLDWSLKGRFPQGHFLDWVGKGFTLWGTYSVKGNHTRDDFNQSFYIGSGEPSKELKIWRYKPMESDLYFATIISGMGGGGLKYGEQTDEMRDDLVLHDAIGFRLELPKDKEYSNGFVFVPSWSEPFKKRTIYWKPNDIELGH